MIWVLIFLVSALIFGCFLGLVVLFDVLRYRDLQRRLRAERERKAEK